MKNRLKISPTYQIKEKQEKRQDYQTQSYREREKEMKRN